MTNIVERNWVGKQCQVTDLFELFIVATTLKPFSGDYYLVYDGMWFIFFGGTTLFLMIILL